MPLSEQLRAAIRASAESGNAIAKAAGISQPVMSRFLSGNDIKFSAADKLATYFGLVLTKSPAAKRDKK